MSELLWCFGIFYPLYLGLSVELSDSDRSPYCLYVWLSRFLQDAEVVTNIVCYTSILLMRVVLYVWSVNKSHDASAMTESLLVVADLESVHYVSVLFWC